MWDILIPVIVAIVVGFVAFIAGFLYRKSVSEKQIGSAEEQAKKIVSDALHEAEAKKKESILEAKEEIHKMRAEADKDIKERRTEVTRQERRIQQKEESLEKKVESLDKKDDLLNIKIKETEELKEKINQTLKDEIAILEKLSGVSN